jgi:hypothetical protein
MANYIPINRIVNLTNNNEKGHLLDLLSSINEFIPLKVKIESFIKLFQNELSEEFLKIYPPGYLIINVGKKANVGLNFIDDILPFGFSLLSLRINEGFSRLLSKINKTSHERISAIIESIFAAKYKDCGFKVELEPPVRHNKFADFKVKKNGEWVYFECKVGDSFETDYLKKRRELYSKIKSKIDSYLIEVRNLAIDIRVKRKLTNKDIDILTKKLIEEIKNRNFSNEINVYRNIIKINQMSDYKNSEYILRVFTSYSDLKDQARITRLINSAREQMPITDHAGIIIIKSNDLNIVRCAAKKTISRADFNNIGAIVNIESGRGELILNPKNKDIADEFIKISISKPLPSFYC